MIYFNMFLCVCVCVCLNCDSLTLGADDLTSSQSLTAVYIRAFGI